MLTYFTWGEIKLLKISNISEKMWRMVELSHLGSASILLFSENK